MKFSNMQAAVLLLIFGSIFSACVTTEGEVIGISEDYRGFVPVKTLVLPCQLWSSFAYYNQLPLSNASESLLTSFCQKGDRFVSDGFNQQPYMRGYSSAAVLKRLKGAGQADLLGQLPALWHNAAKDHDLDSTSAFYKKNLADDPAWQKWLSQIAATCDFADVVLLPMVTHLYQRVYQDRGVAVAELGGGFALLMIDTNNGHLVWSQHVSARISRRFLSLENVKEKLEFPPWEQLQERVFVQRLWTEYPGRIASSLKGNESEPE